MSSLPAYMVTVIRTAADADAFTRAIVADDKSWHYDDDPHDCIPGFTEEEADALEQRANEMRAIAGYDPFELLCDLTRGEE